MKKLILFISISLLQISCSNNKDEDVVSNYPNCIKIQIDIFLKAHPIIAVEYKNYPKVARVDKFNYKEQIVYVVTLSNPGDADYQSEIVNDKCEKIGTLGGIAPNLTDLPDWKNAIFIETVWSDPR